MKKRFLSILILLSILVGLLPTALLPAKAAAYSGTCGEHITWTFDSGTGVLNISGTGIMTEDISFTAPWSSHNSDIKTVVIGDGVESIGYSAFEGCSNLTSVTIPDSIMSIGDYAFMGCQKLKSMKIPEGVMSISAFTFVDCSSLTSVTIPGSVTDICEYAFYNCSSLTSVTIPDGVINIGSSAFASCSSLTDVTIPASVTSFGENVFASCSSLNSLQVAEENTVYSSDTAGILFNKAKTTLISCPGGFVGGYSIPSSVTSIGDSAFAYCSGLTGVAIPSSVTSIGNDAFSDCSGLTKVSIPGSVTSIGSYAFYNCDGIVSVTISKGVKSVGMSAFEYCSSLLSVTIPDSVTSIGDSAFSACSSLASVTIPDSVISIGRNAFSWCSNLMAMVILNKACTIAGESDSLGVSYNTVIYGYVGSTAESYAQTYGYSFTALSEALCEDGTHCYINGICLLCNQKQILGGGCGADAQWTLDVAEGSLTISGSGAMSDYSGSSVPWSGYQLLIKEIVIGEGITSIENSTFSWHDSLTSITIPSSVVSIGEGVFFGCSNLASIRVAEENSVYSCDSAGVLFDKDKSSLILCPNAFTGEYRIPDSVRTIEPSAFECCYSLTSITIPSGVTSIGTYAFSDCINLNGIWVADENTTYCSDTAGVLYNKDKTILICCPNGFAGHYTIADSVTSIGDNAFSGCGGLTTVTIPDTIVSIGDLAFAFCSGLTSITIPDSVTSIGYSAFSWCGNLAHVHFIGDKPTIADEAFSSCSSNLTLCYIEDTQGWDNCPFPCAPWNYNRTSDCIRFLYTCNDCGGVYSYTSEDAHTWEFLGESYVAPNCTEEGKNDYSCTVCSAEKSEPIPALGHQPGELLSETFMYWEHTCLRCNQSFHIEKDDRYRAMQLQGVEVGFSQGDIYSWKLSENDTTVGATALISSNQYEDSSSSETTITLTAQQTFVLSFSYMVSSEDFFDNLTVLLDDSMVLDAISGSMNGIYRSQELPAGAHTLTLCYAKDSSASGGTDTGYLYNIVAETVDCSHPTLQLIPAIPASCTELGRIAYWYCSICNTCFADIDASTEISAEDLEISATGHSYENGICLHCGQADPDAEQLDSKITIYHSLNLVNDISVNFAVNASLLAQYDSYYMECRIPQYEGNVLIGTSTVQLQPVLTGSYYYFTLVGLTAVTMGDQVESVLHMQKGNAKYISYTDQYSVASYAYSQLEKVTAGPELKILCANLLQYGAAAQRYKGYRTDSYADAAMTQEQRSYLTDLNTVSFQQHNQTLGDLSQPVVLWQGKSLTLDSKITLKYVINVAGYSGNVEDLSLQLRYQSYNGESKLVTLTNIQKYGGNADWYSFDFDGLLAAELRQVVSAAVYQGETRLSETLEYSCDSYGNGKTGNLLKVCQAMVAYSDAALLFFQSLA